MAYGFGTTFGTSATTDAITAATVAVGTVNTWHARVLRQGVGGASIGHIYYADNGSGSDEVQFWTTASVYTIRFSRGANVFTWTVPVPANDVFVDLVVTYDAGLTTNDPLVYFDNVSQTVTQATGDPTGSWSTTTRTRSFIGNRVGTDAAWDGIIAEVAHWTRALTIEERALLAAHYAPSFIPNGLAGYRPLVRSLQDIGPLGVATGSVAGALVQPHPRIILRPRRQPSRAGVAVVAAAGGGRLIGPNRLARVA